MSADDLARLVAACGRRRRRRPGRRARRLWRRPRLLRFFKPPPPTNLRLPRLLSPRRCLRHRRPRRLRHLRLCNGCDPDACALAKTEARPRKAPAATPPQAPQRGDRRGAKCAAPKPGLRFGDDAWGRSSSTPSASFSPLPTSPPGPLLFHGTGRHTAVPLTFTPSRALQKREQLWSPPPAPFCLHGSKAQAEAVSEPPRGSFGGLPRESTPLA